MKRLVKPRVLAITNEGDSMKGVRLELPLVSLKKQGLIDSFFITNPFLRLVPDDFEFDVIWVQRYMSRGLSDFLSRHCGDKYIYDIDDLIISLPGYSNYQLPLGRREEIILALGAAKVLTFSTQRLCSLFEKHSGLKLSQKTIVCPNSAQFPAGLRSPASPQGLLWISSDKFGSGPSASSVFAALSKFGSRRNLTLYAVGAIGRALAKKYDNILDLGFIPYWHLNLLLASFPPLLGIGFLDHEGDAATQDFICGKSDIKMVMFGGFGHPGIFSKVGPYVETDLRTGTLVENTEKSWTEALEYMWTDGWKNAADEQAEIVNRRNADRIARECWAQAIQEARLERPLKTRMFSMETRAYLGDSEAWKADQVAKRIETDSSTAERSARVLAHRYLDVAFVDSEASIAGEDLSPGDYRGIIIRKNRLLAHKDHRIRDLEILLQSTHAEMTRILESKSWRVTSPMRAVLKLTKEQIVGPFKRMRSSTSIHMKTIQTLSTRGIDIIRKEGPIEFMARAWAYMRKRFAMIASVKRPVPRIALEPDYDQWIATHERHEKSSIEHEIENFSWKPRISIITPVYNVAPVWLDRCISSVLDQYYENWELCLHDDASTHPDIIARLEQWATKDQRIKVSFSAKNEGISGASNRALSVATGDFVGLLDHDDELTHTALYEVVKLLNEHPDTDLVYSDEDKITEAIKGKFLRHDPFFKPDWDPHLLMASMYLGHFSVYRKKLIDDAGGFRDRFNFSQDYDLALRVTEKTTRIRHIPYVLYHWRTIEGSAAAGGKDYARPSNVAALESAIQRRHYNAETQEYPFANRVRFHLDNMALVSIVIPSDSSENVFTCVELVLENTSYKNYEIIVVTNSSVGRTIRDYYGYSPRIRISVFDKPFNFSMKCNQGVAEARGDYVLFLNDDVHAIHPSWLEDLLEVIGKGNVGAVSPRMYYENDTIQHAGMVTGVRGLIGTAFHCWPKDSGAYYNMVLSPRNASLLSAACLLMPKSVFLEVGGFDEINTPIMDSDVDLCFKVRSLGYELIYQPFACLRHVGHLSIAHIDRDKVQTRKTHLAAMYILKRWGRLLSEDPYYTQNMREHLYENGKPYYRLYASRQDDRLMDAPNILIVSHDLSLSGAPMVMYNLACDLVDKGYFVTVISPVEGMMREKLQQRNIPVMIDATLSGELHHETKKFMAHFDLMIVNTITMFQAVYASKELLVPAVWVIHESDSGCELVATNSVVADAFHEADVVAIMCKKAMEKYRRLVNVANFNLLTLGIKPLAQSDNGKRKEDSFVILNVGSVEERKGQDILIESILGLPENLAPHIKVYMVGRILIPEFYEIIRERAEKSRWNFSFVGQVPHEDLATWYDMADVVLCSSRDETGPMTVLEAMSRGKAVISTDVGSVTDMITDGREGIIIPTENSAKMRESIELLYNDPGLRERMGRNAREKFVNSFTFNHFSDQFIRIVENTRLRWDDRS